MKKHFLMSCVVVCGLLIGSVCASGYNQIGNQQVMVISTGQDDQITPIRIYADAGAEFAAITRLSDMVQTLARVDELISAQGANTAFGRIALKGNGLYQAQIARANNEAINLRVAIVNQAMGRLVDADMNQESTRLQALQVRQQLGVQALSIANQSSQSVLSLFR